MSTHTLNPNQRWIELATKVLMIALATVLIVSALMTVFPFLWSALLSTRDRTEIFGSGISFAIGDSLAINYAKLLEIMPFWQAMFNSIYVAFLGTAISLLFCSMGGYAFAVYQFKGKNILFGMLVGSMMIPPVLSLIPYFMIVKFLGLLDNHVAVWLPFTTTPFGIFLMRQHVVASIPKELLEAAKLDGAGEFRTYWSVVLPLMKPALATLAIVQFVFFWNSFMNPLVVLTSPENYVITQALRSVQGIPNTPWGAVMLGTTISILPLVTAYLFASKQMISGLTSGAVKG
ncbi:putative ABC-type sugar transport system,permease component [Vibrio nigripulchritudo MADA3029]|uniref:sn-glycerol-3-phosphate transport system permease protein UgpE n=2 Tax=Vibrio nigripulchritudo TaxID=28173 RepID=U4KHQ3_9VIBR|nr:carbohydrate ABC transporter permease [Vibrio nigripulchritudo]CCN33245.1 putative ABC-type sugar transport system,permease component [Vibrio nigripulchritudo AM115]CCN42287.1 putative ABC-type sugar transport system,permease component [Vibrio nigripulchritudo FTn2]CCN45337.1 putative ABC-type sugar transport system,permease component [Vibrio nigripulchritudo MADA3020]CCN51785.1 putative ABC-type sugar transport system,permease component [Vibrio nigripulchritudo MADA3021]CCN61949.1 putative